MYNSILNKIKSIPVPTITPTPQKIKPVLKGTLLPEALPRIQESNRAYSDMYNSILNKIKSIPVPTITPTPQKIKPVLKGTLLPEALPRIQESNRAYSDMLNTQVDYPSAQKTAQGVYKIIKKQFTPREEAVPVRRAFEKEPVMTKAPPIVTSLGQLGFSILEAIPRAGATFYGEVLAPDRKTGEVDIGINAKRLGYENEKYTTAAQEFKNKVDAGENPWIAGLDVVSNKTLDVAFGAQLFANLTKYITIKLVTGAEDRVLAKQTIDAFKNNQKQFFQSTKNLPIEQREKVLADLINAKNQAEKILAKEGAPTILDKARLGIAKYTEIASRQTPLGKGFVERFIEPDLKPSPTKLTPVPIAGELPGMRERPGQAPGVGLSLREMESVGGIGGKPLTVEQKMLLIGEQNGFKKSIQGGIVQKIGDKQTRIYKNSKGDYVASRMFEYDTPLLKAQGVRDSSGTEVIYKSLDEAIAGEKEWIGNNTQNVTKSQLEDIVKQATQAREQRLTEEGYIKPPLQKAKKHKSVEEFVRAQGESVFRGSTGKGLADIEERGVSVSKSKEIADIFSKERKGITTEHILDKNAKIANAGDFQDFLTNSVNKQIREMEAGRKFTNKDVQLDVIRQAKAEGYDVIDLSNLSDDLREVDIGFNTFGNEQELFIINQNVLKPKSQLEDIWNKANKNVEIEPPHLKFDSTGRPLAYTAREEAILQKAQELPITSETKSLAQIAEQEGFAIPKELQTPKEIKLSENVYETNRSLGGGKETVKEKIKKYGESVEGGADKIIGVISTRLKNLNPVLKREMRDYEYKLATNTEKDFEKVVPFMKSFKKLSDADFADLDLALKNSDVAKTNQIIKKNGLDKEFNEIRTTLDDLYNRAKEVGFETPYRGNYFPRQVRDSNKFMEYLEKTNEWNKIDEIIKKKEEELQRYLTNEEKAVLSDFSINTGEKKGIEVGSMKERTIEIIDGELNKFYVDSNTALNNYIQSVNEAIESWKFFTKGLKVKIDKYTKLDDTIDAYVFQKVANGVISPAQATELTNILKSRFADIGTKGIVTLYKNLSYIDTMGSLISAITQIGDLGFSLYRAGLYRTLKHTLKALVGRSNIKRADIGIDKIAQEFADPGAAAKLLSQVFKSVGLTNIDAIGKETLYNAIIDKYRKQALNPTPDFMRRMEKVFGNETSQIIADLKSGQNTENVKMLAFNELLDVQPIKLSEMPEAYLKGGNGRIFYMLKTYTIKLFDVYRNEVFQEMKRNKAKGIVNLIKLTGALVLANATADEIKDFILGRKTSFKDRTIDNLLRLVGFSKFGIYKARQEGLPSAFLQSILPPVKFLNNLYKDIVNPPEEAKDLRTIQSIPLVGKLYYWWFGRGAEPKSDFPEMPDLPEPPDMPKPPKLPKLPKL